MTPAPHRRVRSLPGRLLRIAAVGTACLAGVPTSANALDLLEAYQLARTHDALIQEAFHNLESTRQNVPIARSTFRPQLDFNASGGFTDFNSDNNDTFLDTAIQIQLTQTIYNRENSALVEQAKIGVLEAEAQFASLQQDLILRVATAYFNILRAEALVEFSQSELQATARQREQAERRFDVGLVAITDVRTSQAQSDLAIAAEIDASNQMETAIEALRVITGIEADQLSQLAADFPLSRPEPDNIDEWVDQAREQNLPLVIARLTADNARAGIKVERAQRYPTIQFTASASTFTTEQSFSEGDAESGEFGLQATVPIYTGGRIKAQIAQARAAWQATTAGLNEQERAAVQQARDGFRGVTASIARARALSQALASTRQSAEAVDAGFRAGTRTSVEVLNAMQEVFQARSDFVNARYDYILNSLQLKSAAGILDESDLVAVNRFLINQ